MAKDMEQTFIDMLEKNPELLKAFKTGENIKVSDAIKQFAKEGDYVNDPSGGYFVGGEIVKATSHPDGGATFSGGWGHYRRTFRITKEQPLLVVAPGQQIEDLGVYSLVVDQSGKVPILVERCKLDRRLPGRTLRSVGEYTFDSNLYTFFSYDIGRDVCIVYRDKVDTPPISTGQLVKSDNVAITRGTFLVPSIAPYTISVDPDKFVQDLGVIANPPLDKVAPSVRPIGDQYSEQRGFYVFSSDLGGKIVNITYSIKTEGLVLDEVGRLTNKSVEPWVNLERRELAYYNSLFPRYAKERKKSTFDSQTLIEQTKVLQERQRKQAEQQAKKQEIDYERNQKAAKVQEQIRLLEDKVKKIKRGETVEEVEIKTKESEVQSIPTEPRRRKIVLE